MFVVSLGRLVNPIAGKRPDRGTPSSSIVPPPRCFDVFNVNRDARVDPI